MMSMFVMRHLSEALTANRGVEFSARDSSVLYAVARPSIRPSVRLAGSVCHTGGSVRISV